GTPFGVGHIRVRSTDEGWRTPPSDIPWTLTEESHRALYPAFVRESLAGVRSETKPIASHVYFLFQGDTPLQLKLDDTSDVRNIPATPASNAEAHAALLRRWWQH